MKQKEEQECILNPKLYSVGNLTPHFKNIDIAVDCTVIIKLLFQFLSSYF